MVDALGLGPSGATHRGSNPLPPTLSGCHKAWRFKSSKGKVWWTTFINKEKKVLKDREIELKYVIPFENILTLIEVDAFNRHVPGLSVESFSGPFGRSDYYLDTADLALLKSGCCFRFGPRENDFARLTFKKKTADPAERIEISDRLPVAEARASIYKKSDLPTSIAALREQIGHEPVFLQLRVYKLFNSAYIQGCEVVFGHTVFAGGRGAFERLDLEIEAKGEADFQTIKTVGEILSARYRLSLDMRSKYEVGMERVGGAIKRRKK